MNKNDGDLTEKKRLHTIDPDTKVLYKIIGTGKK